MGATADLTKTRVTLRLSGRARAKLARQAASSGQDISAVATELIEHAVTRPSIAQIMSPVWKQVTESKMSGKELDGFLRRELDAHRRGKKAKTS